jgi:acetyltransferase-like isoleucine patch superfamily enzyme
LKKYVLVFLSVIHILALVFLIDTVFPAFSLIPEYVIRPALDFGDFLFCRSAPTVFLSLLIAFSASLAVFIIGYNLLPKHRVGGTLTCAFSFILDLILITIGLVFSFLTIIFSKETAYPVKLVLVIVYVFLFLELLFFVVEKTVDVGFFFADVFRERKEYRKLSYTVEKNGKLTHIRINTSGSPVFSTGYHSVLSGAPSLLIEQALFEIRKTGPISVFLRNAVADFFLSQFTQKTVWPKARSFFFRKLTGAKIGKNCFIGQWTTFDPILPDLIEFEQDCGVGIGCTILTHSYIGFGRMTFTFGPVKICRYARVGAHCMILPGVTIGEGALVASGSVIDKDVPPQVFIAGAPARIRKRKLQEKLV